MKGRSGLRFGLVGGLGECGAGLIGLGPRAQPPTPRHTRTSAAEDTRSRPRQRGRADPTSEVMGPYSTHVVASGNERGIGLMRLPQAAARRKRRLPPAAIQMRVVALGPSTAKLRFAAATRASQLRTAFRLGPRLGWRAPPPPDGVAARHCLADGHAGREAPLRGGDACVAATNRLRSGSRLGRRHTPGSF